MQCALEVVSMWLIQSVGKANHNTMGHNGPANEHRRKSSIRQTFTYHVILARFKLILNETQIN